MTKRKLYYRCISTNKKKRTQQIQNLINKIKSVPINDIILIDETSIDTHINPDYSLGLKVKKLTIKDEIKRIRYTVICVIDYN